MLLSCILLYIIINNYNKWQEDNFMMNNKQCKMSLRDMKIKQFKHLIKSNRLMNTSNNIIMKTICISYNKIKNMEIKLSKDSLYLILNISLSLSKNRICTYMTRLMA